VLLRNLEKALDPLGKYLFVDLNDQVVLWRAAELRLRALA
jgi:hypothetical protein